MSDLAAMPAMRDFVLDAYQHSKFIGYDGTAYGALQTILGDLPIDDGMIELQSDGGRDFFNELAALRYWDRRMPRRLRPHPQQPTEA